MANNNNTKNLNVPNLRFPEFEGKWEKVKLSQIAPNISSGKDKPMAGDITLYGSTGIMGTTKLASYSEEMILVARVGANAGYLQLINERCGVTDNALVVNAGEWNRYLYYYLQHCNLNRLVFGSGQPLITGGMMKKIMIAAGVKNEISKIAHFLSLLDKRIATQIKIIEDLKSLKNKLLKMVFSQELRFPEFNESWRIVTLSDVGTFFSGGTPSTSIRQYYDGNIPFIKSGEINANYTEQFISEEGLRNSSAKMVEVGDLIYALYGATSGEVGISKIEGAINQAVLCIRTNLNCIFLLNFLMFKKEEILRTYLQGGQGNLSAEIIKSLKIPVPIHAEQTKLSHLFSTFEKKIELETNVMTKFKQQKQYLLANLFI